MTEVLHANIFFVITSIAVVIFTVLICVLLFYVIKIVKAVRRIVDRVEAGSEVLAEDLDHLRSSFNVATLMQFVMRFVPGMKSKQTRNKK